MNRRISEIAGKAHEEAQKAKVPENLIDRVQERFEDDDSISWDEAIADIADLDSDEHASDGKT